MTVVVAVVVAATDTGWGKPLDARACARYRRGAIRPHGAVVVPLPRQFLAVRIVSERRYTRVGDQNRFEVEAAITKVSARVR